MVPSRLRLWFVIHFVADVLFALPLLVAPRATLELFGWRHGVDPITTRMVAAALFGIGIESLLGRNNGVEGYRTMLNLKIVWSQACIVGLLWSLVELGDAAPSFSPVVLAVYASFGAVWIYYRWKLRAAKLLAGSGAAS